MGKTFIVFAIIIVVVYVIWIWAISSVLVETSKAVHKEGGLGVMTGHLIRDFNMAKDGKK